MVNLNHLKFCFDSHAILTDISSWILNFLTEHTLKFGHCHTLIPSGLPGISWLSPVFSIYTLLAYTLLLTPERESFNLLEFSPFLV